MDQDKMNEILSVKDTKDIEIVFHGKLSEILGNWPPSMLSYLSKFTAKFIITVIFVPMILPENGREEEVRFMEEIERHMEIIYQKFKQRTFKPKGDVDELSGTENCN